MFEDARVSRDARADGLPSRSEGFGRRMNAPVSDPTKPYRNLIAGYTGAIRASDFKANIAFLFVEFMMIPVLYNYTQFPRYLPIQLVLIPFLIVYFCLFMVIRPRYPKIGAKNFLVARHLTAADFDNVADTEDSIEQLKLRCAVLSDILWWKTQFIHIAFYAAFICIVVTVFLVVYVWVT